MHHIVDTDRLAIPTTIDDVMKQRLVVISKVLNRSLFTWLNQRSIAITRQFLTGSLCISNPLVKISLIERMRLKAHLREALTTVIGGNTVKNAFLISNKMKLRLHTRHGVDLATECWNEEGVHDAAGGQLEVDRHINRHRHFIDRCNTKIRIDKQPFPVERNNFDVDRLRIGNKRAIRVKLVC